MKKSKTNRGVGTYAMSNLVTKYNRPMIWQELYSQLANSKDKTIEISCFLRIETSSTRTKWQQGSLILSGSVITWHSFWRKKRAPIEITKNYKVNKLTWRPRTFKEKVLSFKPQFYILHGTLTDGYIEFVIPELDIPLFTQVCMQTYGSTLKVHEDLKYTIERVRKESGSH